MLVKQKAIKEFNINKEIVKVNQANQKKIII